MRAKRKLVWLAAALAAATAIVTGIAYAAIPDSGGVYTACKLNATGTIRLIDPSLPAKSLLSHCTGFESQIAWNQHGQTGNTGATGATGPAGEDGAAGPAGSNTAYTNYGDGVHHVDTGDTQTVASVTLPVGTYTLSATASVGKDSSDDTHADCSLVSAGALNANAALASLEGIYQVSLPLIGDVTITSDNTSVFLRCYSIDGPVDVYGDIIATQVGTITPSS